MTSLLAWTHHPFCFFLKRTDDSSSEDESTSCDDSDGRRSGSQDLLECFDLAADPNQSPWRRILHLRVSDWPETQQLPSDTSVLLHLYDQVIQLRARHPTGYIVIQCMWVDQHIIATSAAILKVDFIHSHAHNNTKLRNAFVRLFSNQRQDVMAPWLSRLLSTGGSWIRLPL